MNKLILLLVVWNALPLLLGGCVRKPSESTYITGAQHFMLSSNEVERLSALAGKGDKDAAFKLFEYYAFSYVDENDNADEKAREHWLKVAVDLGHEEAKLYLRAYEKYKIGPDLEK